MLQVRRQCLKAAVFLISICSQYAQGGSCYVVQPGDTLSKVAQSLLPPGRIYGPDGALSKILKLNKKLRFRASKIFVGEQIYLPEKESTKSIDREDPVLPVQTQTREIMKSSSSLIFTTRASFSKLQAVNRATSGTAALGSSLTPGFDLRWEQDWNSRWKTQVFLGIDRMDFQTGGPIIQNPVFTKSLIGSSVLLSLTQKLHIRLNATMGNSPFINAKDAGVIELDSVAVPSLNAGLSWSLARTDLFEMWFHSEIGVRFSAGQSDYRVQTGYQYHLGLGIAQISDPIGLHSEVFFKAMSQGSSMINQTETLVGISFGASWKASPPLRNGIE